MPDHPFTLAYIGLGLFDETSILRDGDAWAAEYHDVEGKPYLVVFVGPELVKILEFDGDRRVAMTVAPNLHRAIGMHGGDALDGDVSRFWKRVARGTPDAWVQISSPKTRYSFIPAMGVAEVCLPMPLDARWQAPGPGPIARRIDLGRLDRATVTTAVLSRSVRGEWDARVERIRLVQATMPGILVPERVESWLQVAGPTRSIEWRPFVLPGPVAHTSRVWPKVQPLRLGDGATLTGFALVADRA